MTLHKTGNGPEKHLEELPLNINSEVRFQPVE
jgi:hypothetical protein